MIRMSVKVVPCIWDTTGNLNAKFNFKLVDAGPGPNGSGDGSSDAHFRLEKLSFLMLILDLERCE